MSNAVLSHIVRPEPPLTPGANKLVAGVLAAWFALVVLLGAHGMFVATAWNATASRSSSALPFRSLSFSRFIDFSRSFRAFVLGLDLRLVTAIQAWRFAGLGFIALYTYGVLPGLFAWPAGLGDMAIGLTAPWVMRALERRPEFAASQRFAVWNLLGILDQFDSGWHGNSERAARYGYGRRDHYGSDGGASAGADSGVSRADLHHAARRHVAPGTAPRRVPRSARIDDALTKPARDCDILDHHSAAAPVPRLPRVSSGTLSEKGDDQTEQAALLPCFPRISRR